MTRALFLTIPLLAACVHTPPPCDVPWPRTCEERRDAAQDRPFSANPQPERPVDVSPPASTPEGNGAHSGDKPKDHSRDDNGGSSDGNSDDGNGGKSDE